MKFGYQVCGLTSCLYSIIVRVAKDIIGCKGLLVYVILTCISVVYTCISCCHPSEQLRRKSSVNYHVESVFV